MAAPIISISSESSDNSMESVMPRVILFCTILTKIPVVPTDLPVAPEVIEVIVASPDGVLEMESHSSSETGPSESPLPLILVAPTISPFLCSDGSESEPTVVLPERHVLFVANDAMVDRWRSRVMYTSHHSSSDDFTSDSLPDSSSDHSLSDHSQEDIDVVVMADVGAENEVGVGVEIDECIGLDVAMQQLYDHIRDIPVDRIASIKTGQRQLEADSVIASAERAGLSSCVMVLESSNTRLRETLRMESMRADKLRRRLSFMEDELRLIRRSRYYERMRFRRFETFATRRMGFRP
ncbi:hypothetical protein Tco_0882220 [Tanacetum coccineum]